MRLFHVPGRTPADVLDLRPGAERRIALAPGLLAGRIEPGAKGLDGVGGLLRLPGGRLAAFFLRRWAGFVPGVGGALRIPPGGGPAGLLPGLGFRPGPLGRSLGLPPAGHALVLRRAVTGRRPARLARLAGRRRRSGVGGSAVRRPAIFVHEWTLRDGLAPGRGRTAPGFKWQMGRYWRWFKAAPSRRAVMSTTGMIRS